MKKVVYLENKELIDTLLKHYGKDNWFGETTKVYVTESQNSLLAHDFNPIGIPQAADVTVLSTEDDWEYVIISFQNLLIAKQDRWVHVTVSVNREHAQWFRDNGYRLLVDQGKVLRFQKSLNKEKVKELKRLYVDTLTLE